ncbi:MAG TPA: SdrD B-like domain-containing protein [Pirellulales bacterium]|jgi:cyclophilin family peptidyl-prolyl cis-trans isomerase|nr:SdrD B-like domain-containing protein [Pirellulales bacterium]
MFPRIFSPFRRGAGRRRKGFRLPRTSPSGRSLAGERLESRCYLAADPIVTVDTNFGNFQIELLPSAAPQSVTNFLSYVTSGAYTNTIFHRSEQPSASNPSDIGIIQTGGFTSASPTYASVSQFQTIPTNSPIPLEYNLANASGTVAMARTNASNSATDEFFINDIDNSTNLGPNSASAGYAVFGKILGNGMQVVNQIAALSTIKADPTNSNSSFNQLPLGANNQLARITSVTLDSIDGTVFTDTNGNGQLDSGEPGVAGRTVFVNIDGTSQPDSNNPSTTTDANGNFTFSGIAPGSHTVMEVLPAGVSLTTRTQTVSVSSTSTASGVIFGEAVPAKITGTVFLDYNSNGQLDSGEQGIAGRTVFLNKDNTGAPDANNPSTTTDANGNFTFSGIAPNTYTVMEVLPANVTLTTPAQTITVTAAHTTSGVNFGERPAIIGTVFNDLNLNGKFDGGEPGIPGVTVFLNNDGTGAPDSNNPSTVTNASGTFAFEGLAPGSYPMGEVVAPFHGTTLTTTPGSVTVAAGHTATQSIGNALTSAFAPLPVAVNKPAPLPTQNASFINDVYLKLLGRAADSAALSHWEQQFTGGVSHPALVQAVWNSTEHRALEVGQFYHTFLGRNAEPSGQAFWVGAYSAWGTEKIEAVGFLSSPEYSQRLHPADADFINALYTDVALRPADPAGLTFWQNALKNGESRLQVAFSFLSGQESNTRLIDSFYSDFLYRAPDTASMQAVITKLEQNTVSVEAEGVAVLASDEYFRIAGTG